MEAPAVACTHSLAPPAQTPTTVATRSTAMVSALMPKTVKILLPSPSLPSANTQPPLQVSSVAVRMDTGLIQTRVFAPCGCAEAVRSLTSVETMEVVRTLEVVFVPTDTVATTAKSVSL